MRSFSRIINRLPFALKVILTIPGMIFGLLLALIMAPFQIAYHMSGAGKELKSNFHRNLDDQNFKKAIALIELHKLRFGSYPESLNDPSFQEFMGDWDKFIYSAVTYSKLGNGYELNLNNQDALQLEYSPAFWNGLGLVRTNVKGFRDSSFR